MYTKQLSLLTLKSIKQWCDQMLKTTILSKDCKNRKLLNISGKILNITVTSRFNVFSRSSLLMHE